MEVLVGRVSWLSFLFSHGYSLALLLVSPTIAVWSFLSEFREKYIVAGFALLVGIASLVQFVVRSAGIVTRFRLTKNEITFSRLGRRARTMLIDTGAVVGVWMDNDHSASVWLNDGTSLYLDLEHLANARELAHALQPLADASNDSLEGCLNRSAVAMTLVGQLLIACVLLAISIGGLMILAIAFHPFHVPRQWVFLVLGCLLISLCAVGFYFAVPRYWMGCVRWFRLDRGVLYYSTLLSRGVHQRLIADLKLIATHRPQSHAAEWSSWKEVRFRGGGRIKLRIGELQNAAKLYEALKAKSVRSATAARRILIPQLRPDHPLQYRIEPVLEKGETLYWVGAPVYRRLWSEMAAGVVLGLVLSVPGFGGLTLFCWLAIHNGELGALFAGAVASVFAFYAAYFLATPWSCRSMMRETVYAVTSRRALILDGLTWGERSIPERANEPVESFGIDQLRDYQLVGGGRDISLGGDWRRGGRRRRRQYHWIHRGFLSPDDVVAAESALLQLLAEEPQPKVSV